MVSPSYPQVKHYFRSASLPFVSPSYILAGMSLANNLKSARKHFGLTQDQVGLLFNPPISREAVSQWEKDGGTRPDISRLKRLAERYQTTVTALMGDAAWQPGKQEPSPIIDDDKYYYIPCYSQAGGMGNGRSAQHEEITGKHSYSQSWLLAENLDPAQLCRIKGDGDSMLPTIAHKDSILVNKAENRVINGKVFAFRVGDEIRVKRLYRQLDGKVRVVSDNPDKAQYPDEFLSIDDMPEIIGRVRDRSGTNNL